MESEIDLGYLLAVSAAAVWTPRPLTAYLQAFGDARSLVRFARGELPAPAIGCAESDGREPLSIDALARIAAVSDDVALAALAAARADGQRFTTPSCDDYPRRLRELCDPPAVLYYRGELSALSARTVAIVGSRAATPYGRSIAGTLAADFASFGVTVVSGLARGIDAAAHRGCVGQGAATIAVIGSGLQALYPPYHAALSHEVIAQGGAIISEFPPAMPARAHHFPMRNRLVAALADATVVVEGSYKSGALITARLAAELGRPVFAIPGDVGRPTSEGTNGLIKDGAILTTSAADMCGVLGWPSYRRRSPLTTRRADPVLRAMRGAPADAAEISRSSGVEISAVLARLTMLEIQGRVERQPGGLYVAVSAAKKTRRRDHI